MSGGQFGAHSKLDRGTDDSGVINDAASENPRHSRPINTSRDDPRKSAKSQALGKESDEEEEKVFNIDNESELDARLTENRESVAAHEVTPGEADARFAQFLIALELEQ